MEDSLDYVSDQELLDSIELFVQRAGDDVATLYGSDFSYALDQNNTGGDIGQVIFSIAKPGYPDCYSGQLTAIVESVDGSWFISDCAPSSTVMEPSSLLPALSTGPTGATSSTKTCTGSSPKSLLPLAI